MHTVEICTKIFKCLNTIWTEKILVDFVVKIADETIECHRLILAAFSQFFQALFRSQMREVTENYCVLKDVSCNIFRLILNTLYTGEINLSLENLFEVWRAVNMLQISFLEELCESFAVDALSTDTWEHIYTNAKLLNSERVLAEIHTFMLKNFDRISLSPTFLQLSFKEVRDLIHSQDLVVVSEDFVLETVIRWVKQVPYHSFSTQNISPVQSIPEIKRNSFLTKSISANSNRGVLQDIDELNPQSATEMNSIMETHFEANEDCYTKLCENLTKYFSRKYKLTELLKLVRTCLVSPAVLSRVYKMQMVSENKVLRDMMSNAFFDIQSFRHGQWPTAAVHRSCSEYINAGVFEQSNGEFYVFNAEEDKWYHENNLKCDFLQENIQLVGFDGELYATGQQLNKPNKPSKLFVYCGNRWVELLTMPSHNLTLLSHKQDIYILNNDDNTIYKLNPKIKLPILEKFTNFQGNLKVNHAMIFNNLLLVFCSDTQNGFDKTAVHTLDFVSKVWTRLVTIDGPAEHIISFRNDKHSYVLQSNGSLWYIFNSNTNTNIELKFVFKLWNLKNKLNGALTYNGKLFVLGSFSPNNPTVQNVPGHITHIRHSISDAKSSNFIPIVFPKSHLSAFNV